MKTEITSMWQVGILKTLVSRVLRYLIVAIQEPLPPWPRSCWTQSYPCTSFNQWVNLRWLCVTSKLRHQDALQLCLLTLLDWYWRKFQGGAEPLPNQPQGEDYLVVSREEQRQRPLSESSPALETANQELNLLNLAGACNTGKRKMGPGPVSLTAKTQQGIDGVFLWSLYF